MSQVTSLTSNDDVKGYSNAKRMPSFLFTDAGDNQAAGHILKQSVISNFQHSQFSIMCKASAFQLIFFQALAIFVFVFGCTSVSLPEQQLKQNALYGVFLLFAICLSGNLSGANINPSITLSNYLRKQNKYTLPMLPIYFTGQLLGTLFALLCAKYINDFQFTTTTPENDQWTTLVREFANEMMGTMLMVFFILQITNPNTTFIENEISGFLSIALFFYLAIVLSPQTKSFAINFAITLGMNIGASVFESNHAGWEWIWVYLAGEVVGVVVATLFYDKIFQPIIKNLRQVRRQSLTFSTDFTQAEDD